MFHCNLKIHKEQTVRPEACMNAEAGRLVLKGGHVIDPEQGVDRVADVHIADGKIEFVGSKEVHPDAKTVDVSGNYVSAGWIDIHVHAYGTLGFARPDTIGVYQGVTSFIDAGGPGIGVLDQFMELLGDLKTKLYAGAFIRPMGLLGLNFIEGDVRSLGEVPITRWVDFAKQNRDMLRYIKCNAIGDYGPGTLKLTKGLADILNLPLYMHIGEFQMQNPEHLLAPEAFRIAEAGDMITHVYHGNLGQVIDQSGKVLPVVREAERRGVIFDLGFGGYNFSWDVAEKAYAQDLIPHTISSDLQQFNVVRPVKSLANVMSAMLCLGMGLRDVVERVTRNPAKAVFLTDRAGSLKPGMPADVTVFRVDSGEFEISDCYTKVRKATMQIVPLITFKSGERFDADLAMGQEESNWFLQFAEDHVPAAADALTERQRGFLDALAANLALVEWELASAERLDIEKALELQGIFHHVRAKQELPLKDALRAVYASFLDQTFTMQIGLLLIRLERPFALRRLRDVSRQRTLAA
jgi:dihydroorotase